ncbi:glycerophosphodiester phosphodiesterase [Arthrobacter sp. Soil782]|uniref:glycerophosphodiester phosphodiesterase family protein n=1 Tax=Arthrobacter sp. Soil782 TaxID=1736410 RepID=UPI0006FF91C5|nr:glycerophosphodiester phosphodiesterase family protein [Arthrobacter sp. Soil782]KRF09147.1 glycerophosphodiester phosphodiesterase [Arthrobacter sp. Soil782]
MAEQRAVKHLVFAHRGASEQYAEHTRAAFLQALAEGADGVECDVHLTEDLELVCIHDTTLDRTSSGTGDVGDHTLRQLRELDFASWKGANIPPGYGGVADQLLTLEDLLDLLRTDGRQLELAIELKHPSPFGLKLEERLIAFLMREGYDPETSRLANLHITFMSFNPDSVRHLLERVPADVVCQLVADVQPDDVRETLGPLTAAAVMNLLRRALHEGERIIASGAVGIAGPSIAYVRAHPDRVARWLESGLRLRVWTVDADDDIDLLRDLGAQEITTNRPAYVLGRLKGESSTGRV